MKIVEGLKRLQSIEKKIKNNNKQITKYSSLINTERPHFDNQKEAVGNLLETNKNLFEEYLSLKDQIDRTNNTVTVTIGSETRTINQFLNIKRRMGKLLIESYESLNDSHSEDRFSRFRGDGIHVVRFYDENIKNQNIEYWSDILDQIDGALEVANATVDIVEEKYD